MSEGPEIEGGFELALKAGIKAGFGDLADREDERQRRREALIPLDTPIMGGAVGPAAGDLIFDCGGPPMGRAWVLRRLAIAGTDPTATIAGEAYFYASSAGTSDQLITPGWFDYAASLPLVGWYTSRQVVIHAGQRIWCRVTGYTSGASYVVSGAAVSEIANEPAAARYTL
jgi:hypothetical protein